MFKKYWAYLFIASVFFGLGNIRLLADAEENEAPPVYKETKEHLIERLTLFFDGLNDEESLSLQRILHAYQALDSNTSDDPMISEFQKHPQWWILDKLFEHRYDEPAQTFLMNTVIHPQTREDLRLKALQLLVNQENPKAADIGLEFLKDVSDKLFMDTLFTLKLIKNDKIRSVVLRTFPLLSAEDQVVFFNQIQHLYPVEVIPYCFNAYLEGTRSPSFFCSGMSALKEIQSKNLKISDHTLFTLMAPFYYLKQNVTQGKIKILDVLIELDSLGFDMSAYITPYPKLRDLAKEQKIETFFKKRDQALLSLSVDLKTKLDKHLKGMDHDNYDQREASDRALRDLVLENPLILPYLELLTEKKSFSSFEVKSRVLSILSETLISYQDFSSFFTSQDKEEKTDSNP